MENTVPKRRHDGSTILGRLLEKTEVSNGFYIWLVVLYHGLFLENLK